MAFQLGSEIIDYYNSPERGGLNARGAEIEFALVSTEVQSHDNSANNLAVNNGFEATYLDATNNRTANIRAGFGFFRGVDSSAPPVPLSFAQRRRIVIIDNTNPGNPVILFNNIPLNSGALGDANVNTIKAAIDSVEPALIAQSFDDWKGAFSFPPGMDSPGSDPDRDGADNLTEFFAETNPLDSRSTPLNTVEVTPEGVRFKFQIATDRVETPYQLQAGTLDNFSDYIPDEDDISIIMDEEGIEHLTVDFPPGSGPFYRILLTHP